MTKAVIVTVAFAPMQKQRVSVWLFEQASFRIEGRLIVRFRVVVLIDLLLLLIFWILLTGF